MKSILYLDADEVGGSLVQSLMNKRMGFPIEVTILTKTSLGEKALAENKYDLIISQIYAIDGMLLIRNLREGAYGSTNSQIPAIALDSISLPGSAAEEISQKCSHAGFNSCVTVPYKDKEFLKETKKFLFGE